MNSNRKFDAASLIGTLESASRDNNPMVRETSILFCSHLQQVLDEFEKVVSGTTRGKDGFAKLYLLSQVINDLVAGFHLARQGYSKQAFALLRIPIEAMDMIKLFDKDPPQADHWYAGGKQAYDELSPAKVRKKLGQPKDDVLGQFYHLLSELGTHPSFIGSKNHSAQHIESKQIHIWIGGTIFQYSFLFASLHCFVMTLQLWACCCIVFGDKIPDQTYKSIASNLASNMKTFTGMFPEFFNQKAGHGKSFAQICDDLVVALG